MKAVDIITIIEKHAPPGLAASWDASGVQVAGLGDDISLVAVLLDPTLEALGKAAGAGADFILAHHPLSLRPRFPNRRDEYLGILSLLFTRGVWLYSAHTSLDANPGGPVRWLAQALDLRGLEILEAAEGGSPGSAESGFGFCGALPGPLSYAEFCRLLADCLGRDLWQSCGPAPGKVLRVACCPGSGGGMIDAALAAGADLFVTGDVKYHAALEAGSRGLRVLDVGHFVLEEEMMRRFAALLADELPLPVRFFPGADPLSPDGPAAP